jgi:hypothetical protein
MLTRLTHAAVAFAVMAVLYQAYVLFAVPFIEPPQTHIPRALGGGDTIADYTPTHKHRELLAAYFPANHWTLASPPKSFDNGQAMIVLDDYQPQDDGEVRVNKCAVLFFPSERVPGEAPPRDAVILEAPHGAVIQLDEGFRAGFSGMGRLQWAKLTGDIIVRSDMREPGPQDDLLLKTRDLYMNQDLIRTEAEVEMRLGEHWGKGKVLEIRLVAIERGQASAGPDIGGIDSMEIVENVAAHLAVQSAGLFAEQAHSEQAQPEQVDATAKKSTTELPPVNITCQGRFKFDFTANLASFVDHVKLQQEYTNGARNQLTCDALNLYLAGDRETVPPVVDDPSKQTSIAGRTRAVSALHAGTIEAHGTELTPVKLSSDTHAATAKCGLMRIELGPQRVTFSGQDEISLTYQGNEIHAPLVQYQAPPKESGYRVGTLLAAGNGWLKAMSMDSQSQQPFYLRWLEGMDLRRVDGRPILSVRGRPRLTMAGAQLYAEELVLELRERAADGSEDELLPADVVPDRMVALGHVDIQSSQLSGKINELAIEVQYLPGGLNLGNPTNGANPAGGPSLLGGGTGGDRSYTITGDTLNAVATVRDGNMAIRDLDARGDLLFRETALGNAGTQPLVVRGRELTVRKADTPAAEISLKGAPASITAQGMSINTVAIQVNRGTSGALIKSPGQLQIPLNRGLMGEPLSNTEVLEINWQGGMNLANDRVTFEGDVVARTSSGHLNTNRLVAVLSQAILFDGAANRDQIQLAQIECWDGAAAQFVQRDSLGTTSVHKMFLQSISANQLSGEISGVGPGWLESVHLSTSEPTAPAFADVTPHTDFTTVAAERPAQHLRFLKIEFTKGVAGSLLERNRHVAVLGNVHAVYGPVDAWEQKLPVIPNGGLAPNTIYIESQRLQVAQSPNSRLDPSSRYGSAELMAEERVTIEGSAGKEGAFFINAHRAKYDQQKAKFMVEGDGVVPAKLTREKFPGGPRDEQSFNSFEYYQNTGEWKATGVGNGKIINQ